MLLGDTTFYKFPDLVLFATVKEEIQASFVLISNKKILTFFLKLAYSCVNICMEY